MRASEGGWWHGDLPGGGCVRGRRGFGGESVGWVGCFAEMFLVGGRRELGGGGGGKGDCPSLGLLAVAFPFAHFGLLVFSSFSRVRKRRNRENRTEGGA